MLAKDLFFHVTEIIILQVTLEHVWKMASFTKLPPILQGEQLYVEWK